MASPSYIVIPPTQHDPERRFLYGLIAEFEHPEELVAAAEKARAEGYRDVEGYAPYPVDGLNAALGQQDNYVPQIMLVAGICGCAFALFFIYWVQGIAYPLNIGGKPIWGWPLAMPITFELTVLSAALSGIFGMFMLNGLPSPYHPVFEAPNFERASSDRFFLCIEAKDKKFDREKTRQFMDSLGAHLVSEIELRK